MTKVVTHVKTRDIRDGSRQLDSCGASADDDEVQRRMRPGFQHLPFSEFKREQHAAADLRGVFNRLQSRSVFRPLVFAEIGVRRTRCHQQIVILKQGAALHLHLPVCNVKPDSLIHKHFYVLFVAHDGPDGLRDVCRRQHGECYLVQQWLECVMVSAVNQRDINRKFGESIGCINARKSSTKDQHRGRPECIVAGLQGTTPGVVGVALLLGADVAMRKSLHCRINSS